MPGPVTGQLAVTGSAQQLTSVVAVTAFEIKAPLANLNTVYVGASGVTPATGHALEPGDRLAYERSNQTGEPPYQLAPADFFAVGTSPDVLTWLGSP
jgi:hypothetical protein